MDQTYPTGAKLIGAQVNTIEATADRLRAVQAEEMQHGQVSTKPSEDWLAALDAVVGACVEAGVEHRRARYAATAPLFPLCTNPWTATRMITTVLTNESGGSGGLLQREGPADAGIHDRLRPEVRRSCRRLKLAHS